MDTRLGLAAAVFVAVAASLAIAQTPPASDETADTPAPLPPPPDLGPAVEAPPRIVQPKPRVVEQTAPVPPPPAVLRSPVAVLQVLDKVTAETLRFEAPIGRRVRYKTLVVEVRACETRGYADPEPRASAYLIVEIRTASLQASDTPQNREVFHGWSFAFTPALHAVEHPVYDLWLVACGAAPAAA